MISFLLSKLRENHELLLRYFVVFLVFLCGADFFIERHGVHFKGETIACFWAVFGFAGAVLMGLFCKLGLHKGLSRKEDYYKDKD